jgi:hypothetical protein
MATKTVAPKKAVDPVQERLAEIEHSIEVIQKTLDRLQNMTPEAVAALTLDARKARAHAQSDAFLAIEDLENARLQVLNAEFESRRPSLKWATGKLEDDLNKLQDTVEFINAAASAIGIVTDIVSVIG